MNFNLQAVKLIRKYGKPYPRFLAAGWNFMTSDFCSERGGEVVGIFLIRTL
jgi:hypothetical protein